MIPSRRFNKPEEYPNQKFIIHSAAQAQHYNRVILIVVPVYTPRLRFPIPSLQYDQLVKQVFAVCNSPPFFLYSVRQLCHLQYFSLLHLVIEEWSDYFSTYSLNGNGRVSSGLSGWDCDYVRGGWGWGWVRRRTISDEGREVRSDGREVRSDSRERKDER